MCMILRIYELQFRKVAKLNFMIISANSTHAIQVNIFLVTPVQVKNILPNQERSTVQKYPI